MIYHMTTVLLHVFTSLSFTDLFSFSGSRDRYEPDRFRDGPRRDDRFSGRDRYDDRERYDDRGGRDYDRGG